MFALPVNKIVNIDQIKGNQAVMQESSVVYFDQLSGACSTESWLKHKYSQNHYYKLDITGII